MIDSLPHLLLKANVAATLFMTGVIWFVQVVHYPLFKFVNPIYFKTYEQKHQTLTTWVVAPPMLVELSSAILLFWFRPERIPTVDLTLGLALLVVIWLSTALIQVPCHEALSRGFDPQMHARLVRTNWIRTISWTLRSLLLTGMIGPVAA